MSRSYSFLRFLCTHAHITIYIHLLILLCDLSFRLVLAAGDAAAVAIHMCMCGGMHACMCAGTQAVAEAFAKRSIDALDAAIAQHSHIFTGVLHMG